ncbi:hypothetical protein ACQJBY_067725 [Aegilops geniculata]
MQRGVAASACSTTECTTTPLPPQAQPMAAEAAMDGKKGKKKGGLRTMPFIFANEVAEKLAVVGFSTNMLTYLTQQMHMPLAKAATTLTNFGGTSAMTPLIGAYLADACIGRFWTIAGASVVYQFGMALLTVSAALPQFRPAPCKAAEAAGGGSGACEQALPWQLAVLYVSLFLNAVGAGGYRPCIVAFGADQFDESQTAERARTWGFFNWYYFCNGASQLVAVTAVVYVQDNVGWGWGLGVPAFCMGVSVVAFVGGYPMYRRLDPSGSPFTRLAQVVVAAVRKRRAPRADDPGRLYENDEMDAPISMYGKLVHTPQLRPQDIRRRSAHTSIVPNFLWATAFSFRRRIQTRQQWIQVTKLIMLPDLLQLHVSMESSKNYSYSRSPTSRWNCSSMLFQLMGYSIHGMQWRRWGTSQYFYRAFILLTMTMDFPVLRPHFHPPAWLSPDTNNF